MFFHSPNVWFCCSFYFILVYFLLWGHQDLLPLQPCGLLSHVSLCIFPISALSFPAIFSMNRRLGNKQTIFVIFHLYQSFFFSTNFLHFLNMYGVWIWFNKEELSCSYITQTQAYTGHLVNRSKLRRWNQDKHLICFFNIMVN